MNPYGISAVADLTIERLVPHRGRMKLVDAIIAVDEHKAVSQSVVTDDWPLATHGVTSPLVLIELVAQTASIHIGWLELQKDRNQSGGRGWLVGIKSAYFNTTQIPIHACIITQVEPEYQFENYTGIFGCARIDTQIMGEVRLQVMRSNSDSVLKPSAHSR